MPALLHIAPRIPTWLIQQTSSGPGLGTPQGVPSSIAVRRWAATPVTAADSTETSLVNTAIQKPSNEVIGGAVVGSLVGVTLIILLLLCCCYTEGGGSDTSTTSSTSTKTSRKPRPPPPDPPPAAVPIRNPGPGPPPPPPVQVQTSSGGPPPPAPPPAAIHIKPHPAPAPKDPPKTRLVLRNGELARARRPALNVRRPGPPPRPRHFDTISHDGSESSEGIGRPPRRRVTIQDVDDRILESEAWRKTLV